MPDARLDNPAGMALNAGGLRTEGGVFLTDTFTATGEGTVNKIKMIKRQMYGRAGFDLLRKRVILHPA